MRVFVAGATGAIGRRLVPLLQAAGHEVTGMTRSQERAARLREAGAEAVVCDALDREGVHAAVAAARPEVVVHQLTQIPLDYNPRKLEEQFAGNDRLRREGTPILVDAAVTAGARRVIAQSIAFAYAPEGAWVKAEEDRLWDDAPAPWRRSVGALRALERSTTATAGIEGVVLRYGFFYGPGTMYASDGSVAAQVRGRRFPIVGRGAGHFSFIQIDDAARATVRALADGPAGIFNIVDDEPAPVRDWLPVYAEALGAPRPMRVPVLLARLVAGSHAVSIMTGQRGASNAKARRELGWAPEHASWRDGFRRALG